MLNISKPLINENNFNRERIRKNIEYLLENNNYTKQELCSDLSISLSTFDSWKKRNTIPTTLVLINISNIFNITMSELLFEDLDMNEIEEPKEILERIRILMKRNQIQRQDFCRELGISTAQYDSWEKRSKIPSWKVLFKIADSFNVTLDWILRGKELYNDSEKQIYEKGFQEGINYLKNKINKIE